MPDFVSPDDIRAAFSSAMSLMYRAEVPLYGDLLELVGAINDGVLAADPALRASLVEAGELDRLGSERHGAIRVGTADELRSLARVFAVMGMRPVGYYDLSVAGVPVHSTAFRPVEMEALHHNAFRVFTSLLRLELVEDAALRAQAANILAARRILSDHALALAERAEADGGLGVADAATFVEEVLRTFRWHGEALVDRATYERLGDAHRLIADVVAFKGPHINHLTPRTLDIDAAQVEMARRGLPAKAVIEGPPPRAVPILLRQTSFTALEERIGFAGDKGGTHTARFGEIEQRGVALTAKGRALYDTLLDEARNGPAGGYDARLAMAFEAFPDDLRELRQQGLAFFRYRSVFVTEAADLEELIATGAVVAEPIVYEDFLPVSAAGIFQSNLGGATAHGLSSGAAQAAFEKALGSPVLDPFALYEAIERRSLADLAAVPAAEPVRA